MKKADLISGMVLAVFGLLMLAFVIPMQIEQAPAGYVSPRLVPNLAMIVIVGLSVLLIVKSLRQADAPTVLPEVDCVAEGFSGLCRRIGFVLAWHAAWRGDRFDCRDPCLAGGTPAFDPGSDARRLVAGDLGAFLQSARHRDRVTGAWNIFLSAFKTF